MWNDRTAFWCRARWKQEIRELGTPWDFLEKEIQDRGAYLVLMKSDGVSGLPVGRLGSLDFPQGWFVYVGSARKNLQSRIARHLRKRKRFHWHIDYLRARAARVIALPIRLSRREECEIAAALSEILTSHARGFGSSDGRCGSHLFYSRENPLNRRDFHDLLEKFRMPKPDRAGGPGSDRPDLSDSAHSQSRTHFGSGGSNSPGSSGESFTPGPRGPRH